ncbi:hypothetical protein ABZX85_22090 [Streptomyces sp. NPDC004539]|uniref:hypothetical protein n=1 Tax=Streptomyces sp. NPDC004539 TaxID=3154280 RepID=UPI0033ABD3AE
MPNSSYLCSCDQPVLYPSSQAGGFDPRTGVIATDAQAVPLLWLAMFRPDDLVTEVFTFEEDADDGDDADEDDVIEATAPLAPKSRALARLDAALPALARLFPAEIPLDAHAALLREAVERAPGAYVTIELDEIAGLWEGEEEGSFVPALTGALAAFETAGGAAGAAVPVGGDAPAAAGFAAGDEADPAALDAARAHLLALTRLRPAHPFPPARLLLDTPEATGDDHWNLVRLLGSTFGREVPWEGGDVTPVAAESAP